MINKLRKKMSDLIAKGEAGFTLIELMIVIAVIGILVTIALPKFGDVRTSAKFAKVQSELKGIQTSLESYYARNQEYPDNLTSLEGVDSNSPYIDANDGNYNPDSDNQGYEYSYTHDGTDKKIEMDDSGEFRVTTSSS